MPFIMQILHSGFLALEIRERLQSLETLTKKRDKKQTKRPFKVFKEYQNCLINIASEASYVYLKVVTQ